MTEEDLLRMLKNPDVHLHGVADKPRPKVRAEPLLPADEWMSEPDNGIITLSGSLYKYFHVEGKPIGKPRQTQSDRWKKRPCVMRYRAWADGLRAKAGKAGDPIRLDFAAFIPMPKSWAKKKKREMCGALHRQKPDIDNIAKAISDALLCEDKGIAMGKQIKYWCEQGEEGIHVWLYE